MAWFFLTPVSIFCPVIQFIPFLTPNIGVIEYNSFYSDLQGQDED